MVVHRCQAEINIHYCIEGPVICVLPTVTLTLRWTSPALRSCCKRLAECCKLAECAVLVGEELMVGCSDGNSCLFQHVEYVLTNHHPRKCQLACEGFGSTGIAFLLHVVIVQSSG